MNVLIVAFMCVGIHSFACVNFHLLVVVTIHNVVYYTVYFVLKRRELKERVWRIVSVHNLIFGGSEGGNIFTRFFL